MSGMSDLFSIRGKTAVVTGGSRGIGFMIAGQFLDAGAARVYICARRAEDVGGTAIYPASRAGAYLTGVVIPVAGGIATIDSGPTPFQ